MFSIGATELILIVLSGLIVYFALRGRVSGGLLVILVAILAPVVAFALAMLLLTTTRAMPIRLR